MNWVGLLREIIGTDQYVVLIANLFWAFVGALVYVLYHTSKRDPLSKKSPISLDWDFFFSDNTKRIYATIILIVASVRFGNQFVGPYLPTGTKVDSFIYFLVGLGCDKLAVIFKEKNIFGIGNVAK